MPAPAFEAARIDDCVHAAAEPQLNIYTAPRDDAWPGAPTKTRVPSDETATEVPNCACAAASLATSEAPSTQAITLVQEKSTTVPAPELRPGAPAATIATAPDETETLDPSASTEEPPCEVTAGPTAPVTPFQLNIKMLPEPPPSLGEPATAQIPSLEIAAEVPQRSPTALEAGANDSQTKKAPASGRKSKRAIAIELRI